MLKVDTARSRHSAADALTPLWRHLVDELRAGEAEVRLDGPDGVHRFRVASRRLRSNLAGLRPLLDAPVAQRLREGLREAAGVVGDARDAEVVRHRVDLLLLDEPEGPASARIRDRLALLLEDTSQQGRSQAVQYFDGPAYDDLTRSLDRFSDIPPWTPASQAPAEETLTPLLLEEWNRFRRSTRRAADAGHGHPGRRPSGDDELHDARKAAKRARYVAEAMVPVFGRRAKHLAKAAERVQVVLGDYQDSVVTRAVLDRAAREALSDGEDVGALRRMQEREEITARELRAAFERRSDEADRKSLRRWMG